MKARTVIIDDDPTGCQTVKGLKVYFRWDKETLASCLEENDAFFVLTNTRAMAGGKAQSVSEEVASSLAAASAGNYRIRILSRSDSTLRGYLMEEILPLEKWFGPFDGMLLVPAFFEGDRYTIDNMQYVRTDAGMIPADQTEFAKDPVFGYSTAYLPVWLEEVSDGFFKSKDVISVGLETIRKGPEAVEDILSGVSGFQAAVINAVNYDDLRTVYSAVARMEVKGKNFLFRTAASMVRVVLGQSGTEKYVPERHGNGLIVVGSYTGKTTEQLDVLRSRHPEIPAMKINTGLLFHADMCGRYSSEISEWVSMKLSCGSCILYTDRNYYSGNSGAGASDIGKVIADFIVSVCRGLTVVPAFVIAKGGITSLTLARDSFEADCAIVTGQAARGVPVWKLMSGNRYGNLQYVVFPGNVGQADTLASVVKLFI